MSPDPRCGTHIWSRPCKWPEGVKMLAILGAVMLALCVVVLVG